MVKFTFLALGILAVSLSITSKRDSTELPSPIGSDNQQMNTQNNKLSLPVGFHDRQTATQNEWLIEWDGTPNTDFYVTYGAINTINGVNHEKTASVEGNQLPMNLTFFLEPGSTITATLNLSSNGLASAKIFRNGSICDSSQQTGDKPAIRVTCFPK